MQHATALERQPPTETTDLEQSFLTLRDGSKRLVRLPLGQRIALALRCVDSVHQVARPWVELACDAKRIGDHAAARSEEITAGPVSVLRHLRLLVASLQDIQRVGQPALPAAISAIRNQLRVPVFPTKQLFDRILFAPIKVEAWLEEGADREQLFGNAVRRVTEPDFDTPQVCVVLGAGNVSAIPVTDALTKILQENQAVLLKMNPVNDYLGPMFREALAPLVDAGFLRIVFGGADIGGAALHHAAAGTAHITGSNASHDAIVWGADETAANKARDNRVLDKPITSELGNVSPWIVVPCKYSDSELAFQAENVAASIVNNASFNCVATKMIVTWRNWPQRAKFLDSLDKVLQRIPPRVAYYPGAEQRYQQFAGREGLAADGTLPWTLLRDTTPERSPELFEHESFVCVCGETMLDGGTPGEFLAKAVEFVNDRLWGTLSAALTVSSTFRQQHPEELERAVKQLRYGTVGLNQWPALTYALMSPPWGAFPVRELSEVQSGFGAVHNTYLLDRVEKAVLTSATKIAPKPIWFSNHRRPEAIAWKLCDLYASPQYRRLPALLIDALLG